MNHAFGLWIVKDSDGRKNIGVESAEVVNTDNGSTVASVHITAWKQGGRDARPAARLIAAAPDLLEALKRCLSCEFPCTDKLAVAAAQAAIAKAEGK